MPLSEKRICRSLLYQSCTAIAFVVKLGGLETSKPLECKHQSLLQPGTRGKLRICHSPFTQSPCIIRVMLDGKFSESDGSGGFGLEE